MCDSCNVVQCSWLLLSSECVEEKRILGSYTSCCCSCDNGGSTHHEELDNVYLMLDPQLHPVSPNTSCQQSVLIFEEHKQESLLALHRNLRRQLELIKRQRGNNVGDDGWVVVPNQNHSHVP
ncbi:hypothetical protein C0J52_05443 [Blattella germanica]|nr:hypothetical protein C0J52_05443 [Blattella germanica]